ncbi:diaminopimelate epimerase [Mesorhizobium sp. VK24D]|uniref:Diaminopimelate epimerase n=1 Tax=Mesorhizobium album TaxID=3072314 RepID=A0ABU4XYU0_9HYPH|nr:diaminopimelate epimerase [Mesorhizobium sp. VK24D]MDX8479865.1 diaminopimelate epimerase [Mesorhizobium sp. VK24D]
MSHAAFLSATPDGIGAASHPFIKMHGLQNCFAVLDFRKRASTPQPEDIVRLCDPRVGIGADQLIVIQHPSDKGRAAGAAAFMRIYNIDGREVSACGNATRCVAYLLMEEAGVRWVRIETSAGILRCRLAGAMQVSVELGPVSLDWRKIPLAREADTLDLPVESGPLKHGVGINIGNPHAVFFVRGLDRAEFARHAAVVQNDHLFPQGANVEAVEVLDDRTIRLSIWERPGLLTEACGTGACAAAFAARRRGLIHSDDVQVQMPGGTLTVRLDGDTTTMTGPVAFCCHGFVDLNADPPANAPNGQRIPNH